MPKIELFQDALFQSIGKRMSVDELELLLETAKGEIDERADADGLMKIELNDTNRPDLWSTAGLGRQLRIFLGGERPEYPFFSEPDKLRDAGERRIIVDAGLKEIRPYVAAFAVSGKKLDEAALKDLIQSQEKLCTNFGQRRKSIAMGVYRTALMTFPVHYKAADPETTRFVPLGLDRELSLRQIIAEHPKGEEFGPIVADFPFMPFLTDANGEALSFPPVINSARIGAVEEGDEELFVELTGTDMESLLLACSIVACDLADAGHTVHPVTVEYPYDTPMGRTVTTPFYFQSQVTTPVGVVHRILGEQMSVQACVTALSNMGVRATAASETIVAQPPEYRNDYLHPVDVAEDVMIGRGMKTFAPEMPSDFTIGRLTDQERFGREVTSIMVGMGFLEMIFPYLGSHRDFVEKMRPVPIGESYDGRDVQAVKISNPMSENYEFVRNSSLPFLLHAESVSGHAAYPHQVFEVGKVARFDPDDNHGVRTIDALGFVTADATANFTEAAGQVSVLFYYLSREYQVAELDDPRFIPGRAATILIEGRDVGFFGELHPQVLENFGITVPVTVCDIDLQIVRGGE
jgi:phenylalanyl-tRNA synthetase beta chain